MPDDRSERGPVTPGPEKPEWLKKAEAEKGKSEPATEVAPPEKEPEMLQYKVELPSRGLLYEGRLPDGEAEVRPMTIQEEVLFTDQSMDRYDMLHTLVSRCYLSDDKVPYDDLLVGDSTFLLFYIRNVSLSPQYAFTLTCTSCRERFEAELEVPKDMRIRALTEEDIGPYEIELPMSKKTVGLRLLRVKDEKEIRRTVRRQTRSKKIVAGQGDPAYILRLAYHVVSIDGEPKDLRARLRFCETLYSKDAWAIREEIERHDCGADLTLQEQCQWCGALNEQVMPFTADFFRPSRRGTVQG
jgi:hypothetical protein